MSLAPPTDSGSGFGSGTALEAVAAEAAAGALAHLRTSDDSPIHSASATAAAAPAPARSPFAPSPRTDVEPVWEDITARLHAAASAALLPGQLLHHAAFSLKESMSATEVGDPKMDAGCHVPNDVLSVDKALASGLIVPGDQLSLFQQLEVIDELLAAEATHLTGVSAAHTVYTCLYLHRLRLVWDSCPLLCAYLLLTLKSLELVRAVVVRADLHTEEDFAYPMHEIRIGAMSIPFNLRNGTSTAVRTPSRPDQMPNAEVEPEEPLYGGLSVEEILRRFDEQHAALEARVAELQVAAGESAAAQPAPASSVEWGPASADSSELHLYSLLLQRFDFRRAWYQLHLLLQRPPHLLRPNLAAARPHEQAIHRSLQGMLRSVRGSSEKEEEVKRQEKQDAYDREVGALVTAYNAALAADPLAVPPPFPPKPSANLPPRDLSFGFDPRITKCIVLTSPPRLVSMLHRRDALGFLQDFMAHVGLLHHLPMVYSGVGAHGQMQGQGGSLAVLHWLEHFHRLRPNVIIRSHLWLCMQSACHPSSPNAPPVDPAYDLFACLQDAPPAEGLKPTFASSGAKQAPEAVQAHWNTLESVVRAHVAMAPSVERMALETLALEGSYRRGVVRPILDPALAPMTYHFFLTRLTVPLLNYVKILLEHPAVFRRRLLHPDSAFIPDWNILMNDALTGVDRGVEWGTFLEQEDQMVAFPAKGLDPHARASHPHLLYAHPCYSLIADRMAAFQLGYFFSGLEGGLYTVSEFQVVLWYMEHSLHNAVSNRKQAWRNAKELIALKRAPFVEGKRAKGGAKAKEKKIPLAVPGGPLPPPPPTLELLLLEAQQHLARGLIQLIEGLKRVQVTFADGTSQAVHVPHMDDSMAELWFEHRFGDLRLIHLPAPLKYADYRSMLGQFSHSHQAGGAEAQVKHCCAMATTSMQQAKELLGKVSAEIKNAAAETMDVATSGVDSHATLHPYSSVYAPLVKSLLQVCVANLLLPLTFPKAVAGASAANKALRLALRWEVMGGSAFAPLHSARMGPFPVLQLNMTERDRKGTKA